MIRWNASNYRRRSQRDDPELMCFRICFREAGCWSVHLEAFELEGKVSDQRAHGQLQHSDHLEAPGPMSQLDQDEIGSSSAAMPLPDTA